VSIAVSVTQMDDSLKESMRPDSSDVDRTFAAADPSAKSSSDEMRAAVQSAVLEICSQADREQAANQIDGPNVVMSPAAIATLSELVYLYATKSLAPDLKAFRQHAGRRTVTESDVKLVLRKYDFPRNQHQGIPDNPLDKLRAYCDERSASGTTKAQKPESSVSHRKLGGPTTSSRTNATNPYRQNFTTRLQRSLSSSSSSSTSLEELLLPEDKAEKTPQPLVRAEEGESASEDEVEVLHSKCPAASRSLLGMNCGNAAFRKPRADPRRPTSRNLLDDTSSSESESGDENNSGPNRLQPPKAKGKSVHPSAMTHPKKRFKLDSVGKNSGERELGSLSSPDLCGSSDDDNDHDDDDDDDDLLLQGGLSHGTPKEKKHSRVQQILDTMESPGETETG